VNPSQFIEKQVFLTNVLLIVLGEMLLLNARKHLGIYKPTGAGERDATAR
jgi:hypothetical protein